MAQSAINQVGRLLRGREIQFRAVVITAIGSYFLQLIGILLHWALWAIALGTILPWIPLLTMKVLWSSKHYGFMAIYLVLMILQAGHVGEHLVQMLQFIFIYDPHANPPCLGWNWQGYCGLAHGVFGELDRETVHFIWDGLILVATIVVRIYFRKSKNVWLTLAVIAAAIHQVEHIYLFGNYVFNNYFYNHGGYFLGVHIVNGLAAQNGLLGYNGFIGSLFPFINPILPARINLHFIYNTLVLIPMVLAFRKQLQYVYDEWLAKAMPQLSEEQLIAATAQSENVRFRPGQVIFQQGDPADKFYIITKGQVDITRSMKKDSPEVPVGRLAPGQFFGEIELLGRAYRSVTARAVDEVECLTLNREVFKSLLAASSETYKEMDVILRRRLSQLGALQGIAVADTVNADSDTIMKTRMIREKLKLLQGDDVSRILGRIPLAPAAAHLLQPKPVPTPAGVGSAGSAWPGGEPPTFVPPPPAPVPVPVNKSYKRGVLLVRSGPAAGQRFEIKSPRVLIGRRSRDTITDIPMMLIDDARISRQHLEIVAQPDGLYVRDLGSANGTWLDGRQVGGTPVLLEDGAELHLGPDSVLNFHAS
jgi:CRP-like cAMP-binding protein